MKTTRPTVSVKLYNDVYFIVVRWKGRATESTKIKGKTPNGWKKEPKILARINEVEMRVTELMSGYYQGQEFTASQCLSKASGEKELWRILREMERVKGLSSKTVANYTSAIKLYYSYFNTTAITTNDLIGWAKVLRRKYDNSSLWAYFTCLRALFRFAGGRDPFDGWNFQREGYKTKQAPKARTKEEVKKLERLFVYDGNKYAGIWLASYQFCGLALVDMLRVDWRHLEPVQLGGGRFYAFRIARQKTNQTANVVTQANRLTMKLVELMREVVEWPYSKEVLAAKINWNLGRLDFNPKLTYYQARHTRATALVNANTPLTVISSLLGRNVRGLEGYIRQVTQNEALAEWVYKADGLNIEYL